MTPSQLAAAAKLLGVRIELVPGVADMWWHIDQNMCSESIDADQLAGRLLDALAMLEAHPIIAGRRYAGGNVGWDASMWAPGQEEFSSNNHAHRLSAVLALVERVTT